MARLNTTKPKAGDDTRPNKKPVRHLGQRGVLQSRFRDTLPTSDSEDRDDTQWSKFSRTPASQSQRTVRHQRTGTVSSGIFDIFSDADGASERDDDVSRSSSGANKANKDGALDLARVNSLLRRPSQQSRHRTSRKSELYNYDKENDPVEVELAEDDDSHTPSTISRNPSDASTRRSPVRNAQQTPARNGNNRLFSQYRQPERRPGNEDNEDNDSDSLDEFIVSDNEEPSYHETSDNETEEEKIQEIPPSKPKRKLMRGRRPNPEAELLKALERSSHKNDLRLEPSLPAAITLPPSPERQSERSRGRQPEREGEELSQNEVNFAEKMHHLSLEDNDPSAQLQQELFGFLGDSGSGSFSTTPEPEVISLETPPRSSGKNILRSPSKGKTFIPPTPYRESVDAFWNPEVTNDWFDRHSPHKRVNRLLHEFEESENEVDRDIMPRRRGAIKEPKTPSKTALKRAETEQKKAALARRRSFDNKKTGVAEDFFKTLDDAVTGGRIQAMAAETGGVRITWSKTLQTTAGRASWRRERSMSPSREGHSVTSQKQFAGIELAARIIDNEDRLINTLAHEYCHLANYMISNVTNNPHGTSFKLWGQKCKEALKDHPIYGGRIEVTTKHSYKIDWKYVWCCVDCGQSYGRHSKSIDPTKSTCGKCKGLLQQIKPKPRNVSPRKKPAPQGAMGFPGPAVENVTMVLQEVNLLH